jgi:hypothetical protein
MLLLVLVTLVIAYVGLCVLVFLSQRQLVFPVPPGVREPELPGATLLRIPGPEGATVYALHVPAPDGASTVVHFHGNGVQLGGHRPAGALSKLPSLDLVRPMGLRSLPRHSRPWKEDRGLGG